MGKDYILEMEAYQYNKQFYPVEICLMDCSTQKCDMFFVRYDFEIDNATTRWQYRRHNLRWKGGGNMYLDNCIRQIKRILKPDDIIYVKGDQKMEFFKLWLCNSILEIEKCFWENGSTETSKWNDVNKCAFHKLTDYACARDKCFLLFSRYYTNELD